MAIRQRVKQWVERAAGVHIVRAFPHGHDPFADLAARLPGIAYAMVFDVGANRGQSIARLRAAAPTATLHCFEPIASAFAKLQRLAAADPRIQCHALALGARSGGERMLRQGSGTTHYVLRDHEQDRDQAGTDTAIESIAMQTLDDFCAERRIARIDYLKVDTEGFDLDVLVGAERALSEQRAEIVEVEAGMSPTNTRHVPFEQLKAHLEARGYLLFGLYEQVWEWPTGAPNLRRANAVFLSRALTERYTRAPASRS